MSMRRFAAVLVGWVLVLFALAPPAQAAPLTTCSAELYAGDARLGPAVLPKLAGWEYSCTATAGPGTGRSASSSTRDARP